MARTEGSRSRTGKTTARRGEAAEAATGADGTDAAAHATWYDAWRYATGRTPRHTPSRDDATWYAADGSSVWWWAITPYGTSSYAGAAGWPSDRT